MRLSLLQLKPEMISRGLSALQGKCSEAIPLFARAIKIADGLLGPDNPLVAALLSQQAMAFMRKVSPKETIATQNFIYVRRSSLKVDSDYQLQKLPGLTNLERRRRKPPEL